MIRARGWVFSREWVHGGRLLPSGVSYKMPRIQLSDNILDEWDKYMKYPYEMAGALEYKCSKKGCRASGLRRVSPGDSANVLVPRANVNFHTHPESCYREFKAMHGFFSGDDIREAIRFNMSHPGNFHVVVTMEGYYGIQLTPELLAVMHNLTPRERGIATALAENFFVYLHHLRSIEYNQELVDRGKDALVPTDFVEFTNNFRLDPSETECGAIECKKIPTTKRRISPSNWYKVMGEQRMFEIDDAGKDLTPINPNSVPRAELDAVMRKVGPTTPWFITQFEPKSRPVIFTV